MYCWPVSKCFMYGNRLHCYQTLQCLPSQIIAGPLPQPDPTGPVIGPGPGMGVGPAMSTMLGPILTPYQKCYNECMATGGWPQECKYACTPHHPPRPYSLGEPAPSPWILHDPAPQPW
jgi:hypothetical protein